MNKQALGLIETVGMAAAVEAADTCVKSANVNLIGYELTKGSGLITVKIQGDVGAVKSAVDAAKISAGRVNTIFSTLIIPRPAEGIASIVESKDTVGVISEKNNKDIKIEEKTVEYTNEIKNYKETLIKDLKVSDEYITEETTEKIDVEKDIKENQSENHINNENKECVQDVTIKTIENDNVDNFSNIEKIDERKNKNEVCNLCRDPKCPRRKGQPRNVCIHYKNKKS